MSRRVSTFAFIAVLLLLALNASPQGPLALAQTATPNPGPDLTIAIATTGGGGPGGIYEMGFDGGFRITITNSGNQPVPAGTGLTVVVTLPPGFGYRTAGSGGGSPPWACPGADVAPSQNAQTLGNCTTTLTANLDVGAGAAISFPLVLSMDKFAVPGQTLQARVNTVANETNINNNATSLPVTVQGAPDMVIAKVANFTEFVYNVDETYTIQVSNNGKLDAVANAVTVVDSIPAADQSKIQIVGAAGSPPAAWSCSFNPVSATCHNLTTITVVDSGGGPSNITITVRANAPSGPTTASNSANVVATGEPPSLIDAKNSVTTPPLPIVFAPDLIISKTAGSPDFAAGSTGTFTLTVTNQGQGATVGPITVQDTLPGGLTLANFTTPNGFDCSGSIGTSTVSCTLTSAQINAGASASVTLTVNVPAGATLGPVTNTATVQTPSESNTGNNTSQPVTVNIKSLNVSIAKAHTPVAGFVVGTNGTYDITLTNNGTGPNALNSGAIQVVDTLPAGLGLVSSNGTGWAACTAGTPDAQGRTPVTCDFAGPLNAGTSTVLHIVVSVAPAAGAAGTVTNHVTFTTAGNIGTPTSADDPTTIQGFDLTVSKTFSPQPNIPAATSGIFIITAHNAGTTVATSGTTTVTDPVPTGFVIGTINSTGWTCTVVAQDVSCTYTGAAVAAGADFPQIRIPVTPDISLAGTAPTNTATVANTNETNTANDTGSVAIPVGSAPAPSFSVVKAHSDPCAVSVDCDYTVTVTNTGQVPITNPIVVTDTVPASFTLTSVTGSANWTCTAITPGSVSVTCTTIAAALPLPANGTLTFHVHATPTSTINSPYTNNVTATSGTASANFGDVTHVTAAIAPDLQITKTHATNMVVGTPASYTITVTNVGVNPVVSGTVLTVSDNLPSNMQLLSASGTGWSCAPTTGAAPVTVPVVCTLTLGADLTQNQPAAALTIGVNPVAATNVINQVSVATVTGETNTANNTANDPTTVTAAARPDITIAKAHTGAFTAGQNGQYDITVTNMGSAASSTGLTVTDPLPAALTIVSASGGGWTCNIGTSPITCTNPATNFASGTSLPVITVIVHVSPTASGQISNTATVNQPANDANPNNNTSTDTVTVQGAADLSIAKSHSQNMQPAGAGTYTITVTNVGSVATTTGMTTTVTDTLPSIMTVVSAGGTDGWVCGAPVGQVLTCTRATAISAGQATSFSVNVQVAAGAPAPTTVNNVVSVTNGSDSNATNNTFTDPTFISIGATADLSMALAPNPVNFTVNGSGTVSATITNSGQATFTGPASFTVAVPAGLTLTGGTGGGFTCTGNTCSAAALSLAAGAHATVTLTFSAGGTPASGLTITATLASADANTSNDSASIVANIVAAPPASATTSTINAAPSSVPADGTTTTTITVTVRDASNNPLSGKTVNLTIDQGSLATLTISGGGTGSTNASGVVTFTATSTSVQTVRFVASVPADGVTITNGARTVQFTQPIDQNAISATRSSLTTSSNNPATGTAVTITVHVVLNSGQPAVGAFVTLFSSVSGPVYTFSNPITDANGIATFGVISSTNLSTVISGQATTASGLGPVRISQTQTITWGAGSATVTNTPTGGGTVDGTKSSFTTNFVSIPADNVTTATLTATLRNSSSSPISGKTITVTWNPVLAGMSLQPTSAVTDSNGNASFTVRSVTQGGPVTFTATDTTDSITITQTVQITFTAPGTAAVPSTTGGAATAVPGVAGANGLLNPPSNGPSIGVVVPYILCVRSGPGTNYPALGRLQGGTLVVLLGKNPLGTARNFPPRTDCQRGRGGATWFLIQLDNNQTGWVSAFYIRVRRLQFRHLPIVDVPGAAK